MNEDEKRRFDSILELNKQCWERMEQRRTYEWRVAFALWAVIVGLTGLLFTSSLTDKWGVLIGLIALGIAISILHLLWLRGLNTAMSTDRGLAIHWANILQELTKSQFTNSTKNELDSRQNKLSKYWTSWSLVYEWFATNILVIAAILVACFRIWSQPT